MAARKTPNTAPKHYVGGGEFMNTRQIADEIGGTPHTVRGRLKKGWTGADLLKPIRDRRKAGQPKGLTQVIAIKIALTYGYKIPTPAQVQALHPMESSTAAYWVNAHREAVRYIDQMKEKEHAARKKASGLPR